MGKEYKKREAEKEKAAYNAEKKRVELVKEAADKKAGIRQQIESLEREIQDLKAQANDAKRKYEDLERRERGRLLSGGGSEKATRTTILARLAKGRVEELRNALVETVKKRDTARERVMQLERILEAFKEEYNPNFNDEGVKRAVKAWEDYAAERDSSGEMHVAAEDRDIEEISKADSETGGINWAEWEAEEEESDVDVRKFNRLPSHDIV